MPIGTLLVAPGSLKFTLFFSDLKAIQKGRVNHAMKDRFEAMFRRSD
jgi:hypothetical protein